MICLSSDLTMSSEQTNALTDVDQELLFKAVTKWNTKIRLASKIPQLFRKAFRMATGGVPGAVHLALPENILEQHVEFSAKELQAPDGDIGSGSFSLRADQPGYRSGCRSVLPMLAADHSGRRRGASLRTPMSSWNSSEPAFKVPVVTTVNGKGSVQEFANNAVGVIGSNGGSEEGLMLSSRPTSSWFSARS